MKAASKISLESVAVTTGNSIVGSISWIKKFDLWCQSMEQWRIFFLAAFVLFQGCVVVPAILLITSFYDIGITGLSVLISAFGTIAILVSNISELPIKAVILTFIVNLLISLFLIGVHLWTV